MMMNHIIVVYACRFSGPLEMEYRLDAEKYSRSKLSRVLFVRKDARRHVEATVVQDTLTMNRQTDPNSVCHTYIGHITVSISTLQG